MGGRLIRGPGRLLAAGLALLLASGAARAAEAPPPPPPCPPPAPDAKTLHPNDLPDLPGSYRTLERQAVLTER
ncbi:MAG: hypothetical protein KDE22_10060, partial [Rhodobacterales bacterium]|nr:hypothetical protein [Rhodobacterales bacterium]